MRFANGKSDYRYLALWDRAEAEAAYRETIETLVAGNGRMPRSAE